MSPVTGFIIFCRLEDGNLAVSRLCRRFPILIPFTRRFENRQLLYCLSALVFQPYSLDKSFMSLCPLSKYMRMHFRICDPSGRAPLILYPVVALRLPHGYPRRCPVGHC